MCQIRRPICNTINKVAMMKKKWMRMGLLSTLWPVFFVFISKNCKRKTDSKNGTRASVPVTDRKHPVHPPPVVPSVLASTSFYFCPRKSELTGKVWLLTYKMYIQKVLFNGDQKIKKKRRKKILRKKKVNSNRVLFYGRKLLKKPMKICWDFREAKIPEKECYSFFDCFFSKPGHFF